MTTFSDADVTDRWPAVLERARADGEVRIRHTDGGEFILRPAPRSGLDVGFVKLRRPIGVDEIVAFVREGRERG